MSEEVMYQHINLYVNDYSVDLGADGRQAVEVLFERRGRGRRSLRRRSRCSFLLVRRPALSV